MKGRNRSSAFLMIAVPLLASLLIVFSGAFSYLMWGEGYFRQAESLAAVLFPPRDLDGTMAANGGGEELYNMVINAAVAHSQAGSYHDVTINSGGVTLKNKTVLNDLIISKEVDSGEVMLQNVVVRGDIIVEGGAKVTLDGVTAVTMRAQSSSLTEYRLTGETTVYELEAAGPAAIDERGLKSGYYGIKRVSAPDGELLKNVQLRFGTVEQTVRGSKNSK